MERDTREHHPKQHTNELRSKTHSKAALNLKSSTPPPETSTMINLLDLPMGCKAQSDVPRLENANLKRERDLLSSKSQDLSPNLFQHRAELELLNRLLHLWGKLSIVRHLPLARSASQRRVNPIDLTPSTQSSVLLQVAHTLHSLHRWPDFRRSFQRTKAFDVFGIFAGGFCQICACRCSLQGCKVWPPWRNSSFAHLSAAGQAIRWPSLPSKALTVPEFVVCGFWRLGGGKVCASGRTIADSEWEQSIY